GGGKCEVIAVVRRYSRWANMMFISSLKVVEVVVEMVVMEFQGGTSEMLSSKGFKGRGEVGSLDDVDGVFDGAFGGVGDEEVVVGEGVVRFSSSFVRSTNSCFGGMMVSLIFLKPWEEEA
ncbi:hypothetical protein Tco_0916452, partial [Tanacetum coccineum]